MILEKDHIKLRALEPSDVDLLYQWENDTDIWLISNTIVPFSRYILGKYIEDSHKDIFELRQLRFMIDHIHEQDLRTIGAIDLFEFEPMHKRAGVGILIKEKNDRLKGFATTALEILISYCQEVLHLHQLYCNIATDNKISLRLFQKFDFVIVGNKREWNWDGTKWDDEYLLQKIL